jgi:hypothetical protein
MPNPVERIMAYLREEEFTELAHEIQEMALENLTDLFKEHGFDLDTYVDDIFHQHRLAPSPD